MKHTRQAGWILLMIGLMLPFAALAQEQTAVVATTAADFSSGAHAVVSVDPVGGPRTVQSNLSPTISDVGVDAYGSHFYRMERYGANNVTKFSIDAPSTIIWQYSTEGDDSNSNPYDMVFVSETKAYLLRYGTDTAWIVNPSAATEAEFKTGELDLSAYADADGIPEMHSGIIVDGRLYIVFQRLDENDLWAPKNTTLVGVFDTVDDTEITQITVPVENPIAIQYLAETDTIYVAGVGDFGYNYFGGIAAIDVSDGSYPVTEIIDGETYGGIVGMIIVSAAKGYFIGYGTWQNNTLYTFNPSAQTPAPTIVSGFESMSIAGMQSGVYLDQNNMLWLCNQTDGRVDILNTSTDTVDESVDTELNPQAVVFVGGSQGTTSGGDDGSSSSGCFINTCR